MKIIKNPIGDYLKGQSTKGTCAECKHSGRVGKTDCKCKSSWCPCHRTAFGHGAHTCACT